MGGLYKNARPGEPSLQRSLPLKRLKVTDTSLAAFLVQTANRLPDPQPGNKKALINATRGQT